MDGLTVEKDSVIRALMSKNSLNRYYKDFTSGVKYEQLSFL